MYNIEQIIELFTESAKIIAFTSIYSVIGIVLYVLMGIGLFSMAKGLGLKNPWLSFIPIANIYAFGRIAQQYIKSNGKKSAKWGIILPVIYIVELILAVAFIIFFVICLFSLFDFASDALLNNSSMNIEMFYSIIPVIILYFVLLAVVIINKVFYYIALWRIFAIFNNSNATLFTVLSVFFGFLPAIFVFAVRKNEPVIAFEEKENIII